MITTRKQNNKLVTNPATRTHLPRTLAQTIFFFFTFFVFFGSSKLTRNGSHFLFLHFPLPRLKILYNYETFTSKISSSSYIRRTLAKFCFSFLDLKKKKSDYNPTDSSSSTILFSDFDFLVSSQNP